MKTRPPREPTLLESLIPVAFLIVFLGFGVIDLTEMPEVAFLTPLLGALSSVPLLGNLLHVSVSPHLPLIAGAAVAAIVGCRLGHGWSALQEGMIQGIVIALSACLILLIVGILIGTWILSGIASSLISGTWSGRPGRVWQWLFFSMG